MRKGLFFRGIVNENCNHFVSRKLIFSKELTYDNIVEPDLQTKIGLFFVKISCLLSQHKIICSNSGKLSAITNIALCPKCKCKEKKFFTERDLLFHFIECSENARKIYSLIYLKIVNGSYVTEEYASRKTITRLVNYLGLGRYCIGATQGNILVQDRKVGAAVDY